MINKIMFFVLSLMFFTTCSDDKSTSPLSIDNIDEIQNQVIDLQIENLNMFNNLVATLDTLTAIDSVLKIFLDNPEVNTASANEQGVIVEYASGITGGLFIDPQDNPEVDSIPGIIDYSIQRSNNQRDWNSIENTNTTIFLNSHYWERKKFADKIHNIYYDYFPTIEYIPPTLWINHGVTLDLLTELEAYEYIHIYSHGLKKTVNGEIAEVYLLSGESPNAITSEKFIDHINSKDVIIVTAKDGSTYYCVTPAFITYYNDFTINTPLIYGGFCYSFLGNWVTEMSQAGVSGYFGFNWSVLTAWNAWWAQQLILKLTDTNQDKPQTVDDWYYDNDPKRYWSEKNSRDVLIKYDGYWDYAFWEKPDLDFRYAYLDAHIKGYYQRTTPDTSYEDPYWEYYETPGHVIQLGSLDNNIFTATWDTTWDETATGTFHWTGSITAKFSSNYNLLLSYKEEQHSDYSTGWRTIDESIEVSNIPLYDYTTGYDRIYQIGPTNEACAYLDNWSHDVIWPLDGMSYILSRTECESDSYINIRFVE